MGQLPDGLLVDSLTVILSIDCFVRKEWSGNTVKMQERAKRSARRKQLELTSTSGALMREHDPVPIGTHMASD